MFKTKEIKTEILIRSNPEKVWNILADFNNYPLWNPFMRAVKGYLEVGKKISIRLEPAEGEGMWIKPKVRVLKVNQELRWLGRFIIPGLFDGEHSFELINNGNGTTTFIQSERFRGILVPMFNQLLDVQTTHGFHLMNQKLKERAEKKTNPQNI